MSCPPASQEDTEDCHCSPAAAVQQQSLHAVQQRALAAPAGLKATFTTAYMHTVIIYIVCLVFAFKVYVPGDLLAGIDQARHALCSVT